MREYTNLTLDQYKDKLKRELKDFAASDGLDEKVQKEIAKIVETGCTEIDAADTKLKARSALYKAQNAITKAKTEVKDKNDLEAAKAKGKDDIEAARAATEKEVEGVALTQLNAMAEGLSASIDSATTVEEIESLVRTAKEQFAKLPRKKIDLEAAKAEAKKEIEAARVEVVNGNPEAAEAAKAIADKFNGLVDNATKAEDIKDLVAQAKEEFKKLNKDKDPNPEDLEAAKKAAKEEIARTRD